MAEEIKIVASAVGFDQVNKALDSTSKTLTQTSEAASQAGKTLGTQLKAGTNQAQQSILNLSRVVQDAPFGFIGIANNINPLVESFSRLKAETGSTGSALKGLLSGLSGPAGLGIAFAVVTTAIQFAQLGLSRWGAATAKAKEETDKFQQGLRSAEQGALANAFRFQELTKVIRDTSKSEIERNQALEEANKILEPYGKKIDSINISLAESTSLTDSLTTSLVNQAVALKIADRIADLTISKREKINEIKKQELYIDRITAANAKSAVNGLTGQTAGYVQLQDAVQQLNIQKQQQAQIEAQINSLTADYDSKIVTTTSNTKKQARETETLAEALAKFEKSLKAIQTVGTSLGTPQFDINQDKIKEFESFLKKIIEKFNVDPSNKVYINLEARLNKIKDENFFAALKASGERARKAAADILGIIPIDDVVVIPRRTKFEIDLETAYRENIINELERLSKKFNFELPLGTFNLNTEGLKKQFDEITKSANGVPDAFRKNVEENLRKSGADVNKGWQKYSQDINNAATGFLTDAATNIAVTFGEALGAALSGGNFGNVFSGIFELLAGGVESLGKQLIAIGTLAIIAQQALADLLANPFAAIGVGIALVALGAALKNLTKRSAFATGTRYAPGGMALVGERGPEMINLPRGSQVIPAAQTSQMMGGIGGAIEVFGMLRGQDIFFSNRKYGQTYKRTT